MDFLNWTNLLTNTGGGGHIVDLTEINLKLTLLSNKVDANRDDIVYLYKLKTELWNLIASNDSTRGVYDNLHNTTITELIREVGKSKNAAIAMLVSKDYEHYNWALTVAQEPLTLDTWMFFNTIYDNFTSGGSIENYPEEIQAAKEYGGFAKLIVVCRDLTREEWSRVCWIIRENNKLETTHGLEGLTTSGLYMMFESCGRTLMDFNALDTWSWNLITNIANCFECIHITGHEPFLLKMAEAGKIDNMYSAFGGSGLLDISFLTNYSWPKLTSLWYTFQQCTFGEEAELGLLMDAPLLSDASHMFYFAGNETTHMSLDGEYPVLLNMYLMFWGSRACDAWIGSFYTPNLHSGSNGYMYGCAGMFNQCRNMEYLCIEDWVIDNDSPETVLSFHGMFLKCKGLLEVDIYNWYVARSVNMAAMWKECDKLEHLDLSALEVASVIEMGSFVYDCPKLKTLDISGLTLAEDCGTYLMVGNCPKLNFIYVGEGFFNATTLDLHGANTLGMNEDGSNNDWLEYFADTAPDTDITKTIILPATLCNNDWALEYINQLTTKGYTISVQ